MSDNADSLLWHGNLIAHSEMFRKELEKALFFVEKIRPRVSYPYKVVGWLADLELVMSRLLQHMVKLEEDYEREVNDWLTITEEEHKETSC